MGGKGSGSKKGQRKGQKAISHATVEMYRVMRVGWSKGLSTGQIADEVRKAFPDYPGTLDRNSVSALIFRARERRHPVTRELMYPNWFPPRAQEYRLYSKDAGPVAQRKAKLAQERAVEVPHLKKPKVPVEESFNRRRGKFVGNTVVPSPERALFNAQKDYERRQRAFEPPVGDLVEIQDLQFDHCRWPYDTKDQTRYCGKNQAVGSSYCDYHTRLSIRGSWS